MRRYVVNRSSLEEARKIRRDFVDKEPEHEDPVRWDWPKTMREVGVCEAVMYASSKWQKDPRKEIDYKHVAEGPQWILVRPGFIREYSRPSRPLPTAGPIVELTNMPDSFAVLAKILGLQVRLYERDGSNGYRLPDDDEDAYYQIDVAGGMLGAAKHPKSGQTFLLVYTSSGVHCIIVGDHLKVEKDGIVG